MTPPNPNPPAKRGRPTVYTRDIADLICERLSDGRARVCRRAMVKGER